MLALAKTLFKSPKILGSIGLVLVVIIGGLYINDRKEEYETTISNLQSDIEDKEAFILQQKIKMEEYKNEVSQQIITQKEAAEKARREAQKEIREREERIDAILADRPEITPENACSEAEKLIDKVLFEVE